MTVIDRIIDCLKKEGKQQIDLASALKDKNVTKQTISDWKRGKSNSYYEMMPEIADYFGVSTDFMLGRLDEKSPLDNAGKLEQRQLFPIKKDKENTAMIIERPYLNKLLAKKALQVCFLSPKLYKDAPSQPVEESIVDMAPEIWHHALTAVVRESLGEIKLKRAEGFHKIATESTTFPDAEYPFFNEFSLLRTLLETTGEKHVEELYKLLQNEVHTNEIAKAAAGNVIHYNANGIKHA